VQRGGIENDRMTCLHDECSYEIKVESEEMKLENSIERYFSMTPLLPPGTLCDSTVMRGESTVY